MQARLIVASYDLARLATIYANQQASLQQQIYNKEAYGKDASASQAYVNDLGVRIAAMNRDSSTALAQLQGLGASGYPGNKGSLIGARDMLSSGKAAGLQAASDAVRARAVLP
jgi:hypothetical protein